MTTIDYWMSLQPWERLSIAELIAGEHGWSISPKSRADAYDHAVTLSVDQLREYLAFVKLEKLVGA